MKIKFLSLSLFLLFYYGKNYGQKIYKADIINGFYKNPFSVKPLKISFQNNTFHWLDTSLYKPILNSKSQIFNYSSQNSMSLNIRKDIALDIILAERKLEKDTLFLIRNNIEDTIYKIFTADIKTLWFKKFFRGDSSDIHFNADVYLSNQKTNIPIKIIIGLNEEYKSINNKYVLGTSYYYEGFLKISNKKVKFFIDNEAGKNFEITTKSAIKLLEDSVNKNQTYKFGDTIKIDDEYIIFKKVAIDLKTIKYASGKLKKTNQGFNVGYRYYDFKFIDLVSKTNVITQNLLKDKEYILLDFWGTWCGPCIKGIPHLTDLYDRFKNKVEIIGIASEKILDTAKVTAFILEKKLVWKNLIQLNSYSNLKGTLIDKYRITAFPTYILIDKNGKIVCRQSGYLDLDKIEYFLKTN